MRAAIVFCLAACGGGGSSPTGDGNNPSDGPGGPEATECPSTVPESVAVEFTAAVDDTHFYFTSTITELSRQPVAGGGVEKIADLPGSNQGPVVLGDQQVFGIAGGAAFRVAKTGGTPESLGAVASQAGARATDNTALYLVAVDQTIELRRAATVGGPTTLLADATADGIDDVVTDGTDVYWTPSQNGVVRRVPVGGGTPEEFADSRIDVAANVTNFGLAMVGDDIIWSAIYQSFPDGRVFARSKSGGERRELSHTGLLAGLEVLGDNLYVVITGGSESAIAKIPLAGGPREIIGCVPDRTFSLKARSHGIYVEANGELFRFAP